jgi:hypothetical protein
LICVKCGQHNAPGQNYCHQCNTLLPKISDSVQESSHQKKNERYLQLKEAGDKVLSGAWTLEEYAAFLDNISRVLSMKEQEIRDMEIPPEAIEDFRQELEVGFSGIQLYNQGIVTMKLYLDDQDSTHLQEGLEMVREGNELINDAMRINRDNRRKLEEVYSDNTTMM